MSYHLSVIKLVIILRTDFSLAAPSSIPSKTCVVCLTLLHKNDFNVKEHHVNHCLSHSQQCVMSVFVHRPVASHRQTLPHNVVSSTPRLRGLRDSNLLTVRKRMIKLTSINKMFLYIEIILCNHVRYSFGLFFKLTIH
jgi:hypothetical protein